MNIHGTIDTFKQGMDRIGSDYGVLEKNANGQYASPAEAKRWFEFLKQFEELKRDTLKAHYEQESLIRTLQAVIDNQNIQQVHLQQSVQISQIHNQYDVHGSAQQGVQFIRLGKYIFQVAHIVGVNLIEKKVWVKDMIFDVTDKGLGIVKHVINPLTVNHVTDRKPTPAPSPTAMTMEQYYEKQNSK
jgi:hypothetical protein